MIALVHYHLRIGGVRRVMEAQAELLTRAGRPFRFIVGEEPVSSFDYPYQVIEGLGYGGTCPPLADSAPDISLWHFHNPTLGKNASLTRRLLDLVNSGAAVLMQLHDFAEDNRPVNFTTLTDPELLYPASPRLQYAFINSRDRKVFRACGLGDAESHLLGNQVSAPPYGEPTPSSRALVFFPVRGIRRKNLGELCLFAAVAKKAGIDAEFAVALRADNDAENAIHDRWAEFADSLDLPIQFDVVNQSGRDFGQWMTDCTHVITCSVAEGFGMSFLEPSLLGLPVIGRDLPEITEDFGPGLDGDFYQSLDFELDVDWRQRIEKALEQPVAQLYQAYGVEPQPIKVGKTWDFGNLPERLQEQAISAFLDGNLELSAAGLSIDTWLRQALTHTPDPTTPQAIEAKFGASAYGKRLFDCYDQLLNSTLPSSRQDFIDPRCVLAHYLAPERFNFLRSPL